MDHCSDIEPLLGAFHDGELPPAQMHEVAQHLVQCLSCNQQLLDFGLLGHELRAALVEPRLEGFSQAVMARIAAVPLPLAARLRGRLLLLRERWVAGVAVGAAALAASAMALLLLYVAEVRAHFNQPPVLAQAPFQEVAMPPSAWPQMPPVPDDQTIISRLVSSHDSVALWSEPEDKTTVIWLPDDSQNQ